MTRRPPMFALAPGFARIVRLLLVPAAVSAFVFALGVGPAAAQNQQQLQIIQQRLGNLESGFAQLRAEFDLQAAEAEAGSAEAEMVVRLTRLEEMLRESSGALETLRFEVRQMRDGGEVRRRDAELRFESLEEGLEEANMAIAAAVSLAEEAREAATAVGAQAAAAESLSRDAAAVATAAARTAAAAAIAAENPPVAPVAAPAAVPVAPVTPVASAAGTAAASGEVPQSGTEVTRVSGSGVGAAGSALSTPSLGAASGGGAAVASGSGSGAVARGGVVAAAPAAGGEAQESAVFLENPFPDFDADRAAALAGETPASATAALEAEAAADAPQPLEGELAPQPLGILTASEEEETAALDSAPDPEAVYQESYALLGDASFGDNVDLQEEAARGFREFVAAYPEHERAPEAQYWVGEILYIQGNYRAAVDAFVVGLRAYKESEQASDIALKMGASLRHLDLLEQACSAFDLLAVGEYGSLSDGELNRVRAEQGLAGC